MKYVLFVSLVSVSLSNTNAFAEDNVYCKHGVLYRNNTPTFLLREGKITLKEFNQMNWEVLAQRDGMPEPATLRGKMKRLTLVENNQKMRFVAQNKDQLIFNIPYQLYMQGLLFSMSIVTGWQNSQNGEVRYANQFEFSDCVRLNSR